MSDAVNDAFGNMEWQDDGHGNLIDAARGNLVGIAEFKGDLEIVEISDAECDYIQDHGMREEHAGIATRPRVVFEADR
jgi:hypothetical protein